MEILSYLSLAESGFELRTADLVTGQRASSFTAMQDACQQEREFSRSGVDVQLLLDAIYHDPSFLC